MASRTELSHGDSDCGSVVNVVEFAVIVSFIEFVEARHVESFPDGSTGSDW